MNIKTQFFEDYNLGETRTTMGRTITETDIVMHAGQTGDFFPHHMNAEWCKGQSIERRIAHGTLIFSIAIGQTAGDVNPEAFSKGYNRLRFINPVFIGDTIHTKVSISDKSDDKNPEYGQITEHVEVFNQDDIIVLACDHILLAERKQQEH